MHAISLLDLQNAGAPLPATALQEKRRYRQARTLVFSLVKCLIVESVCTTGAGTKTAGGQDSNGPWRHGGHFPTVRAFSDAEPNLAMAWEHGHARRSPTHLG